MADSKPPVEAPGPKNEVLETPPAVNVPTTSTTSSPKKEKKLSLYSRFVNMVTPTIKSYKRLDGKPPSGPPRLEAVVSDSDNAKKSTKGKEKEIVDPRTDSANTVGKASSSKDSDAGSTIVVGEASSSRISDAGS